MKRVISQLVAKGSVFFNYHAISVLKLCGFKSYFALAWQNTRGKIPFSPIQNSLIS
jgi:hypothetical protein